MRRTIIAIVVFTTLGLAGSWMYTMPYKAFQGVKTAMDRQDAALMAQHVDITALRAAAKNRQSAQLAPPAETGMPAALTALGAAVADMAVGAMADALLTPEGLVAMLRGMSVLRPQPFEGASPSERLFNLAVSEHASLSRFEVTTPLAGQAALRLVFLREGATWKLTGMEMRGPGQ